MENTEGGVIENPRWPDGCRLTLNELAHAGEGHIDCRKREEFKPDLNGLTRMLAAGHIRRVGHVLAGYYVTKDDGISQLIRTCCEGEE